METVLRKKRMLLFSAIMCAHMITPAYAGWWGTAKNFYSSFVPQKTRETVKKYFYGGVIGAGVTWGLTLPMMRKALCYIPGMSFVLNSVPKNVAGRLAFGVLAGTVATFGLIQSGALATIETIVTEIKENVAKINEKVDSLLEGQELLKKGVNKANNTLDDHTGKLDGLQKDLAESKDVQKKMQDDLTQIKNHMGTIEALLKSLDTNSSHTTKELGEIKDKLSAVAMQFSKLSGDDSNQVSIADLALKIDELEARLLRALGGGHTKGS